MAGTVTVDTDVITHALDLLDEVPPLNSGDNRPAVRLMKRRYKLVVDKTISSYPWNCCIERASLASIPDGAIDSEWRYGYPIPANCLRMLPLRANGSVDGALIPYEINGDVLLTNAPAPLKIRYLARKGERFWSPGLVETVVMQLALSAAYSITSKNTYVQSLKEEFARVKAENKLTDALEVPPEAAYIDAYDSGRRTG